MLGYKQQHLYVAGNSFKCIIMCLVYNYTMYDIVLVV